MKFLIRSDCGDFIGGALRLQEEGNDVCIAIKNPYFQDIGKGMIPHVTLEEGLANKPDVIWYDMSSFGAEADDLKKRGFKVGGASKLADRLEFKRADAMKIAERFGIKVPSYKQFTKNQVQDAIQYVQQRPYARFVLKPDDNLSLELTYVSKSSEDMVRKLLWAESHGILKGNFLIQDFVDGIELSTEGWYVNGDPVMSLFNSTIEDKKFMPGNKGPNTGCEFSLVFPYHTSNTKIVQQTLEKMSGSLKSNRYTGPLDINCIVDANGDANFLEITGRNGYSAIYPFTELLQLELGKFLYQMTRDAGHVALNDGVAMAVTVSHHPYPLDSGKEKYSEIHKERQGHHVNYPSDHFWPYDVMQGPVTAGCLGLVGYATSVDEDFYEAKGKMDELLEQVEVPDMQYRVDYLKRAEEELPQLSQLGYDVPYQFKELISGGV
jgi:phosphoribosylamine---glycine ligase